MFFKEGSQGAKAVTAGDIGKGNILNNHPECWCQWCGFPVFQLGVHVVTFASISSGVMSLRPSHAMLLALFSSPFGSILFFQAKWR